MFDFLPTNYGPTIAALLTPERLAELGPGKPNRSIQSRLNALDWESDFGRPVHDREMARACLSGLWLYHDFLEESHTISQDLPSAEGSYWHAVMHRREPDAGNSKYWWRRVGDHPIFADLARDAATMGFPDWNPFAFVDACEKYRGSGHAMEATLKRIQFREWQYLFDWCYRQAVTE